MVAWDSPTQHSPSFRSFQHRDWSPIIHEPPECTQPLPCPQYGIPGMSHLSSSSN